MDDSSARQDGEEQYKISSHCSEQHIISNPFIVFRNFPFNIFTQQMNVGN